MWGRVGSGPQICLFLSLSLSLSLICPHRSTGPLPRKAARSKGRVEVVEELVEEEKEGGISQLARYPGEYIAAVDPEIHPDDGVTYEHTYCYPSCRAENKKTRHLALGVASGACLHVGKIRFHASWLPICT